MGHFIWSVFGPDLFLKLYRQISKAESYKEYCRILYGDEFCTFNMLSRKQRLFFYSLLKEREGFVALELGHGPGGMAQKVSEYSTCKKLIALDYSGFIPSEFSKKANFFRHNLNKLSIEESQFDFIYCIDSFYHIKNHKKLLAKIVAALKEHGEFVLFHTFSSFEEKDIFLELLRSYKVELTDFTRDDKEYWVENKKVLEAMKEKFLKDSILNVFNIRSKEIEKFLKLHEKNDLFRYCIQIKR